MPNSNYQKLLKGNIKNIIPDSHRFAKHNSKTVEKFQFILDFAKKNKTLSNEIKEKFNLKKEQLFRCQGNCLHRQLPHYQMTTFITVNQEFLPFVSMLEFNLLMIGMSSKENIQLVEKEELKKFQDIHK